MQKKIIEGRRDSFKFIKKIIGAGGKLNLRPNHLQVSVGEEEKTKQE